MKQHLTTLPLLIHAAVLAAALLAPPALARDMGSIGGDGGGDFRTICRPGDHLVGIDAMERNGVVTRVAPICGNRYKHSTDTYGSPWAGTDGGTRHQVVCPPDSILTVLHVFVDGTPLVSRIGFTCWNVTNNKMTDRLPDFGGANADSDRFACDYGEVGSGIYGRAGTAIDRLGLSCEPLPVAEAGPPDQVNRPPPIEQAPDRQPTTADQDTDIFDAPGGVGSVIGVFAANTTSILEQCRDDGWCKIREGWVWGEHITPP